MNILLIHPPASGPRQEEINLREPLGLAYLAAFLLEKGHRVAVLDLYSYNRAAVSAAEGGFRRGASDPQILCQLGKFTPDLVGISCNFTIYRNDALNVARLVRAALPDATIVMGGAYSTLMSDKRILESPIDAVVCGEGEQALLELVQRHEAKQSFEGVSGVAFKRDGGVVRNQPREPHPDLDSLPLPARELLDMDYYLDSSNVLGHAKGRRIAVLITSRGCPYNCIFCSVKSVSGGRRWRAMSPARVLSEIRLLKDHYGVDEVFIYDDNFLVDKKRVIKICNCIAKEKTKILITVPQGLNVNLIDEELLLAMKDAGLYRVVLPIETGNAGTMRFIRKKTSLGEAMEKIRLCHRLGLWTSGNFLIGFPHEKRADIEETIRFAEQSTLDFVFYFVAQPYLGSDLYNIYLHEGLLPGGEELTESKVMHTSYDTRHFSAAELRTIRDVAAARYPRVRIRQYLAHPTVLLRKIDTIHGLTYFLKLMTNLQFMQAAFGKKKI